MTAELGRSALTVFAGFAGLSSPLFLFPVCAVEKKRSCLRVELMATDEPAVDKKDGEVMAVRVKSHTLPNGTPGLRLVAE